MTLGSVQPGAQVITVGKDGTNAIAVGSVCVPDTATTPDSYKIAPASAGNKGPFVVCVNKAAAAADRAFAAALPGSLVTVTADGAIEAGMEVQCSSSTAGQVVAFVAATIAATPTQANVQDAQADRLRVVGRYMGKENELTGKVPGQAYGGSSAAADGDLIIIRLGGVS